MGNNFAKSILATIAATAFEWYDYALYGYFADIIASHFFPSDDKLSALLMTLGVFATGFAMRPLGAVIFGSIGDRLGRKPALVLSMLLMAVPTFCIGCLPSYNTIGIWAPIGLVTIRLLQGLAVGGNYGGALIFAVENASLHNRGLTGSWSVFSGIIGILLGSATATLFAWIFDADTLAAWGWRLPFFLGIGICFLGLYIKRSIPETPTFENAKISGNTLSLPIKDVLQRDQSTIARTVLVVMLHDVGFYVLFVYLTTYMTTILNVPMKTALTFNTITMIIMICMIPYFAHLSDRFGRKLIMSLGALAFVILSFPLFYSMTALPIWCAVVVQAAFAILKACYVGPLPTFVVERYATHGRYSATALTLNISAALFGGTAPFLVTYCIKLTGWSMIPALYLSVCGIISWFALRGLTENFKTPLNKIGLKHQS